MASILSFTHLQQRLSFIPGVSHIELCTVTDSVCCPGSFKIETEKQEHNMQFKYLLERDTFLLFCLNWSNNTLKKSPLRRKQFYFTHHPPPSTTTHHHHPPPTPTTTLHCLVTSFLHTRSGHRCMNSYCL